MITHRTFHRQIIRQTFHPDNKSTKMNIHQTFHPDNNSTEMNIHWTFHRQIIRRTFYHRTFHRDDHPSDILPSNIPPRWSFHPDNKSTEMITHQTFYHQTFHRQIIHRTFLPILFQEFEISHRISSLDILLSRDDYPSSSTISEPIPIVILSPPTGDVNSPSSISRRMIFSGLLWSSVIFSRDDHLVIVILPFASPTHHHRSSHHHLPPSHSVTVLSRSHLLVENITGEQR